MQKNDTVRIRDCPETDRLVKDNSLKSEFGRIVNSFTIFCHNITMYRVQWTNGKLTWELSDVLEVVNGRQRLSRNP
jgi:hypothetical protein